MSYSDMPNWQAFVDEQLKNKRNEDITPPQNKPQEVGTDGKEKKPLQTKGV